MEAFVLDNISCRFNAGSLMKQLHLKDGTSEANEFIDLLEGAKTVARPKAFYKLGSITSKEEGAVGINGIVLNSRVLRVNLDKLYRAFPYVATCGMELEKWARSFDDTLKRFWAETINGEALSSAIEALKKDLDDRFQPGRISNMSPGSIVDWSLTEQRELFNILGDPKESVGIELTENYLMIPMKSVSGILYPSEEDFESCQLCSMEKCPGRRKPYDSTLYERKYLTLNERK